MKLSFEELISLIKQKGFRDTYQILTSNNSYKFEKHDFYKELNRFSYYNSFFRIQEKLVDLGLIRFNTARKKKYIMLTEKGVKVYRKLLEINDIIKI